MAIDCFLRPCSNPCVLYACPSQHLEQPQYHQKLKEKKEVAGLFGEALQKPSLRAMVEDLVEEEDEKDEEEDEEEQGGG